MGFLIVGEVVINEWFEGGFFAMAFKLLINGYG
jgi:hypothetical protein